MEKKEKKCKCSKGCKCNNECSCNSDEKVKELEDKLLRVQAEFINFRNRTSNEVSNLLKYEGESFIKSMLPTLDNFERALNMDNNDLSDEVSKFLEGFKMIYASLKEVLNSNEILEIEAEGLEFNPELMDAVLIEHNEEKPENVVLEVLTKGYTYKGKVIRHAMVKVNK